MLHGEMVRSFRLDMPVLIAVSVSVRFKPSLGVKGLLERIKNNP